ncbi:MAG: phytanoyl-CoA dioxygenase family protein [Cyanobacteria bacterium]|nr:phytanoyl-CoA dioxygenase family protein [Cyanobacteriota bacterium]
MTGPAQIAQPIDIDSFNAENIKKTFYEKGYIHIPNVLSKDDVNSLRLDLLTIFNRRAEQGESSHKTSAKKQYRDIIADFFPQYPELFEQIFLQSSVLKNIQILLDNKFVLLPETSAMRDYFNTLHTDTTEAEMRGCSLPRDPDFLMLTAAIYLQDNTAEAGGGMYFVPGSHNKPDSCIPVRLRKQVYDNSKWRQKLNKLFGYRLYDFDRLLNEHPEGEDLVTKAGDMIIFDSRAVHRSSFARDRQWLPDGNKLALFAHFMRNNQILPEYLNYLYTKTTDKNDYQYLQGTRDISALKSLCATHGFEVY